MDVSDLRDLKAPQAERLPEPEPEIKPTTGKKLVYGGWPSAINRYYYIRPVWFKQMVYTMSRTYTGYFSAMPYWKHVVRQYIDATS